MEQKNQKKLKAKNRVSSLVGLTQFSNNYEQRLKALEEKRKQSTQLNQIKEEKYNKNQKNKIKMDQSSSSSLSIHSNSIQLQQQFPNNQQQQYMQVSVNSPTYANKMNISLFQSERKNSLQKNIDLKNKSRATSKNTYISDLNTQITENFDPQYAQRRRSSRQQGQTGFVNMLSSVASNQEQQENKDTLQINFKPKQNPKRGQKISQLQLQLKNINIENVESNTNLENLASAQSNTFNNNTLSSNSNILNNNSNNLMNSSNGNNNNSNSNNIMNSSKNYSNMNSSKNHKKNIKDKENLTPVQETKTQINESSYKKRASIDLFQQRKSTVEAFERYNEYQQQLYELKNPVKNHGLIGQNNGSIKAVKEINIGSIPNPIMGYKKPAFVIDDNN